MKQASGGLVFPPVWLSTSHLVAVLVSRVASNAEKIIHECLLGLSR